MEMNVCAKEQSLRLHLARAGEFCVTSPGVGYQDTGSNTGLDVMEKVRVLFFLFVCLFLLFSCLSFLVLRLSHINTMHFDYIYHSLIPPQGPLSNSYPLLCLL